MVSFKPCWDCVYGQRSLYLERRIRIRSRSPRFPIDRYHDTRILIPAQQWVVSVLGLRLLDVGSAVHEVFVRVRACELSCNACVHFFYDIEVGWEEDVEVALVDL